MLSPALERDLLCIQLAEVLNVPAHVVPRLPLHWVDAGLTLLEARQMLNDKDDDPPNGGAGWDGDGA